MTSNLYILPHKTEPRFKIGKADCIEQRLVSLGYVNLIDRKKSLYVTTPTAKDAFKLEGYLHYIVNDYRLDSLPEDGGTEWFASECMDTAVEAIKQACDMKGFTLSRGLAAPLMPRKPKPATRKIASSSQGTRVTLQEFRNLKAFLHEHKGRHCHYFQNDYLCIRTDIDETSSTDNLDIVGCRISNRFGGITFVPYARKRKDSLRFYVPVPYNAETNIERAHERMFRWLMLTLKMLGSEELNRSPDPDAELDILGRWPLDGWKPQP